MVRFQICYCASTSNRAWGPGDDAPSGPSSRSDHSPCRIAVCQHRADAEGLWTETPGAVAWPVQPAFVAAGCRRQEQQNPGRGGGSWAAAPDAAAAAAAASVLRMGPSSLKTQLRLDSLPFFLKWDRRRRHLDPARWGLLFRAGFGRVCSTLCSRFQARGPQGQGLARGGRCVLFCASVRGLSHGNRLGMTVSR